jgi:tRNA(fMet)-specific endonuclease VapC
VVKNRFLLDTNAVISLLAGNDAINVLLADAEWVGISVITKLEFLSFSGLSADDAKLFSEFEERVEVVDVSNTNEDLITETLARRRDNQVKLPDALVISSGTINQATVLTEDRQLLNLYPEHTQPLPRPKA